MGTSVYALEALLQGQKIKQAMASSYIAPGALEGKYSQIYDLVFKLHELYESIFGTANARAAMARSIESQSEESTSHSE
jgi:hypothetical protein